MDKWIEQQVRDRSNLLCEYCQMSALLYDQPFHIDHIIARKHGGQSTLENLAFCCLDCNAHKGTNIAGIDPLDGALCRLFHPRKDQWREHFAWNGPVLTGLTPIGRTTAMVMEINKPIRIRARAVLIYEGAFPPSQLRR